MSSEENSLVLDSDEDDSDSESYWRRNELNTKKKNSRAIISESDDADEIISSGDDSISNGRLTPSIRKAIRRSILNISQQEIIDDSGSGSADDSEPEEQPVVDNSVYNQRKQSNHHSRHTGDSSNFEVTIESDQDEDTMSEPSERYTDQKSNEKPPLSPKKIAAVREKIFGRNKLAILDSDSDDEIQVTNVIRSPDISQKIVNIDSDSEKSVEVRDEISEVVNIAKKELNSADLDPIIAQKRAMLVCQIHKIEQEIKKTKIFLREGNLNLLPDKGEKLRLNLTKRNEKLAELYAELDDIPLLAPDIHNKQPESVAPKVQNVFNDHKFDPKAMLKPTANTNTGDFGRKALETFQREQALTVDRLEVLHGSLLSRPTDDTRAEDPRGLRIKLMPHQQHALAWLMWREEQKPPGGVLADDMGLGKTLTMISLVMASLEQADNDNDEDEWFQRGRSVKHQGGTLVVCPASLVSQWEAEIKNRCKRGLLTVELYHGNNRETVARRLARNHVVITTYNILTREYKNRGVIYNIDWKRVILDEAHVIRNHKSQACESVCGILARKRWALTGTPIHNKEMDLFAILKFLQCSPFDDLRVWKRWVDNKNNAGHERLAAVMKSLMLRRTKQELMSNGSLDSLPEKTLEVMDVDLDRDERLIYEKVLVYSRTLFAQFLAQRAEKQNNFDLGAGKYNAPSKGGCCKNSLFNRAQKELLARHADVKQHEILVLLLRLRQVCCHPSLLHSMLDRDDLEVNGLENVPVSLDLEKSMRKLNLNDGEDEAVEEGDVGVDERVAENLLTSDNPVFDRNRRSSKLRAVLKLVEEILKKREKIIIVSQWTSNLDIIAEQLDTIKGATYKRFTGAVAVKDRQDIMDAFNSEGDDPQILLLSLTAGGVGLNLVGANHLMLIDIHWNPQLESQAQDRIYRFGQKRNVFIYKFICTDTIEERIKNLQIKKLEIASSVLTGTRGSASSKLSLDDLKSLFCM